MEKIRTLTMKEKSLIDLIFLSNRKLNSFEISDILDIKFKMKVSSRLVAFYLRSKNRTNNLKTISDILSKFSLVSFNEKEKKIIEERKKVREKLNKKLMFKRSGNVRKYPVRILPTVFMPEDDQPTILGNPLVPGSEKKILCAFPGCKNFVQKYKYSYGDTDEYYKLYCMEHEPKRKFTIPKIGNR